MIVYNNVRSTTCPKPVQIMEKVVWVHTNIHTVEVAFEDDTHTEYEFDATQYTKDEYIKLLDDKNAMLEAQLTDTQLALCEVYELML